MDIVSIFCTRQLTRLRKYDRWKSSTLQVKMPIFQHFYLDSLLEFDPKNSMFQSQIFMILKANSN